MVLKDIRVVKHPDILLQFINEPQVEKLFADAGIFFRVSRHETLRCVHGSFGNIIIHNRDILAGRIQPLLC